MDVFELFISRFENYGKLSGSSRVALTAIMSAKTFKKNEFLVRAGQYTQTIALVTQGLFSQFFTTDKGDIIIKRFFPEGYFCASLSALLSGTPSSFSIRALENSTVLLYDYPAFRALFEQFPDIANAYIRYLEKHWVIEKEPQEISLRYETARSRYLEFITQYPALESRLKQHHIASYLGVTPTQLSRIRSEL